MGGLRHVNLLTYVENKYTLYIVNCVDRITVYVATQCFPLRVLLFRIIIYSASSALSAIFAKWCSLAVCKLTATLVIDCREAEQTEVFIYSL